MTYDIHGYSKVGDVCNSIFLKLRVVHSLVGPIVSILIIPFRFEGLRIELKQMSVFDKKSWLGTSNPPLWYIPPKTTTYLKRNFW